MIPNCALFTFDQRDQASKNIYAGRVRHGYGQYFMGTGFWFILASGSVPVEQKTIRVGKRSNAVGMD